MLRSEQEMYLADVQAELAKLRQKFEQAKLAGEKTELRARIRAYEAKEKELLENLK